METPQDAIQALDTALNSSAANNALCTSISRSSFFEGSGTFRISAGAEVGKQPRMTHEAACPAFSERYAAKSIAELLQATLA